jgi:hypothetical protein
MLQDPENPFKEWTAGVRAIDIHAARQQCEFIAQEQPLTEVLTVTQQTKTKGKDDKYKFICWFRSEVDHDDSSNNDRRTGT